MNNRIEVIDQEQQGPDYLALEPIEDFGFYSGWDGETLPGFSQMSDAIALRLWKDFSSAGLRMDRGETRVGSEGPTGRLLLSSRQEVMVAWTRLVAVELSGSGYILKVEPARFLDGLVGGWVKDQSQGESSACMLCY